MRRPSVLRQLLDSNPGRLGVGAFALLTLVSLYVVATYPADFGPARWSNPAVWSDNPRAAPPAWTNLVGDVRRPVHQVVVADEPIRVEEAGRAEARRYELAFDHLADEPPSFLSFTLHGVTYGTRPPQYTLVLHRPDGTTVPLAREVVSSSTVLGSRSSRMSETRLLPSNVRMVRASPKSSVITRTTMPGRRSYQARSSPWAASSA
jgi:peptide/nickel transport system permease protein